MSNTRKVLIGAAVACCLAVSACGGGAGGESAGVADTWEDILAAAEDEGRVNVYTSLPELQTDRLEAAFEEEYPEIDVALTRGAGELVARLESEINAGGDGADVAMVAAASQWFQDHEGDLLELEGPSSEGWREDYWTVPDKAIVPTKFPYTLLTWNTEIFPDGFEDWDDVLDPSVAGRLGFAGDTANMTPTNAGTLDFMIQELGDDYLSALAEQRPKFYPSVAPMGQAIGSGEIGVAVHSSPSTVKALQDDGAPIDSALPDPGVANEYFAGAIASSKRPNAALVFMDFMMSMEGQEAINGDDFGDGGRDDIPGSLDLAEWDVTTNYSTDVEEARQRFGSIFGG